MRFCDNRAMDQSTWWAVIVWRGWWRRERMRRRRRILRMTTTPPTRRLEPSRRQRELLGKEIDPPILIPLSILWLHSTLIEKSQYKANIVKFKWRFISSCSCHGLTLVPFLIRLSKTEDPCIFFGMHLFQTLSNAASWIFASNDVLASLTLLSCDRFPLSKIIAYIRENVLICLILIIRILCAALYIYTP